MGSEEWLKNIDIIEVLEQHRQKTIPPKQFNIPLPVMSPVENVRPLITDPI
jgi:hypothetical protein